MAKLKTCSDCGNGNSKSARTCPSCGKVLKAGFLEADVLSIMKLFVIFVFVFVLALIFQ
jgi:predicted amidophosphoribosyltransferase